MNFVDLLEYCVPDRFFLISTDISAREKVNETLSKIAGGVAQLYRKSRGRARIDLDKRVRKFHLFEGETKTIIDFHEEIKSVQDELREWKGKCMNLEEEKEQIYKEMAKALEVLEEKEKVIEHLQKSNKQLEEYAENLTKVVGVRSFQGKPVSEAKNKTRTLKTFLSRANMALWFASSFGLELDTLKVKEHETGQVHIVNFQQENSIREPTSSNDEPGRASTFSTLPEGEKNRIEQILFLLDKFCVGDNFYHELSMMVDGLPRSYLVKQCRQDLNNMCHLEGLKGKFPGAKVSSVENLLADHISHYINKNPGFCTKTDSIQIKISGDGAKMTNNSNFILLSFAILQTGESVMSAKGNRTIGIVNGKEDYSTIKESFGDIISEINKLVAARKVNVEGKNINIEFFLGGDYKFILMMLGLKGATSNYACAWCKLHKDERWKMDQHYTYFNKPQMSRSLEEMHAMCTKSKENYCCHQPPLFNIDLDHVVPDELHLLLRVTDILTGNLVLECIDWDKEEEIDCPRGSVRGFHLQKLIEMVRSCGVSFDVWEKRDADGKSSGQHDWTSLMGSDKKRLLAELPQKMAAILHPETVDGIIAIWKGFDELYKVITNWSPEENPTELWIMAKDWIKLFLSMNGKREGYERRRITPYMHIMVQHFPMFLELYGSVKIFTGQGVEKNNDVARSIVLRKSNKWDSTSDVLRHEKRQWELQDCERRPRGYIPKNDMYWESGIRESRQKRKRVSASQQVNEDAINQSNNQSNEGIPSIHSVTTHDTPPPLLPVAAMWIILS